MNTHIQRSPEVNEGGGLTKEQEAFLKVIKSEVQKKLDENKDITGLKEQIHSLNEKLKAASTQEEIVKLKDDLEKIGLDIKSLKEEGKIEELKRKNLGDALIHALYEMNRKGQLSEIKAKKIRNAELEVKAAATMTTGNISGVGGGTPFTLSDYLPGLTRVVRRMPFIQQLVSMATTVKNIVQWVEQKNPDPGAAGTTAEGSAKTQGDFDLVESKCDVEKITYYIKVSKEMLDDVAFIEGEIRREIVELLLLKLDEQILKGDGISPNLAGIMSFATSFSAGSFAATINNANNFDVIRVAINQIETATPNGPFVPNYIVMHPSDVAAMDLTKDAEDRYLLPPFLTAGGNTIKGLPIISNIGMTEGDFLVGDFTKSVVHMRENVTLSIGYENDDFTKNLVTILGEIRACHYIKSNHTKAFVKGTFSTAKAALETP